MKGCGYWKWWLIDDNFFSINEFNTTHLHEHNETKCCTHEIDAKLHAKDSVQVFLNSGFMDL